MNTIPEPDRKAIRGKLSKLIRQLELCTYTARGKKAGQCIVCQKGYPPTHPHQSIYYHNKRSESDAMIESEKTGRKVVPKRWSADVDVHGVWRIYRIA